MGIMFCLCVAMYSDVICNSDTSLAFFKDLIHLFLDNVLGTDQTKGKSQEAVSTKGAVEGSEHAGVLVEYD